MANDLNIVYKIAADITGLQSGVNRAAKATEGLESAALRLGTVVAGAFSVTAVVAFGKAIVADADALVKLHDKTALSMQALQKFQIAGDDAGNTVEELAAATNKMQDLMASSDTAFLKALVDLKINAAEFKALQPEDQMFALSDALRQIVDPAQQVRLSIDTMGKAGATVLPTMKRGFDDLRDAAVGMSDRTIQSLDAMGDRMAKFSRELKSAVGTAIVDFADLARAAMAGGSGGLIEAVATERVTAALTAKKEAYRQKLLAIIATNEVYQQSLKDGYGPVMDAATAAEIYAKKLAAQEAAQKKSTEATKAWRDALKDVQSPLTFTILGLEGMTAGLSDNNEAEFKAIEAHLDLVEALDRVEGHTITASGVMQYFTNDLRRVGIATDDLGFKLDDLVPFDWEGQHQMIPDIGPQVKEAKDDLSDLAGAFAQLAQISGDSWGGALQNIGKVIASVNVMQTAMKTLNDTIAKDGSAAWGQYAAAGASAFSALLVGYGLILDSIEKDRSANHAAFLERSRAYADFVQRRNEFRLTIPTEDLAALDAQLAKLFKLSPRWDRDAFDAMVKEIEAELSRLERISGGARARFGPSKTELKEMAQEAHDIFDFMLEQNKGKAEKDWEFTQDQLTAAFLAYQEALAAAGDEAAKAWLKAHKGAEDAAAASNKALDVLIARRDELTKGIDAEAWEPDMGSIEKAMRAERDAIDAQIAAGQAAQTTATEAAAAASAEAVGGAAESMTNDMGVTAETIEELLRTAGVDAATATEIAMGEAGTNMSNDMGVTADAIEDMLKAAGESGARGIVDAFEGLEVHVRVVYDDFGRPGDRGGDGAGSERAPALAMMSGRDWALPALSSAGLDIAGSGRMTRTAGGGSDRPIQITVQTLLDGQLVAENLIQRAKHDKHGVGTKLRRIVGV